MKEPGARARTAQPLLTTSFRRESLRGIREIYTRMPDIESGEPHFMVGNFLHGVHGLPVHWRP
jgi:hypothetical protein